MAVTSLSFGSYDALAPAPRDSTGGVTVSGVASFTANATAYGRIAQGQWTPAGRCTDTLIVTVTYLGLVPRH